ncbi:MAG: hypothetical protein AAFR74_01500 [Pseudomonadota bacterium]
MNDKVFFPLALLVAGLMVTAALMVGRDTTPRGAIGGASSGNYAIIPIQGDDLMRLEGLAFGANSEVKQGLMTLSTGPSVQPDEVPVGPHFKLAADIEAVFSGQTIRLFIEARTVSGADLEVNYDTGQQGQSGWQRFDLSEEFQEFRFDYNVPIRADGAESGFDYVGLRPVGDALPGVVEVRKIELRRLGRWSE